MSKWTTHFALVAALILAGVGPWIGCATCSKAELAAECKTVSVGCAECGCDGGPGYRKPDGQCLSYDEFDDGVCRDKTDDCAFENHPNSGQNRCCTWQGD